MSRCYVAVGLLWLRNHCGLHLHHQVSSSCQHETKDRPSRRRRQTRLPPLIEFLPSSLDHFLNLAASSNGH